MKPWKMGRKIAGKLLELGGYEELGGLLGKVEKSDDGERGDYQEAFLHGSIAATLSEILENQTTGLELQERTLEVFEQIARGGTPEEIAEIEDALNQLQFASAKVASLLAQAERRAAEATESKEFDPRLLSGLQGNLSFVQAAIHSGFTTLRKIRDEIEGDSEE